MILLTQQFLQYFSNGRIFQFGLVFLDFCQQVIPSSFFNQTKQHESCSGTQETVDMLHDQFAEFITIIIYHFILQPKDALDDFIGIGVSTKAFCKGINFESIFSIS